MVDIINLGLSVSENTSPRAAGRETRKQSGKRGWELLATFLTLPVVLFE